VIIYIVRRLLLMIPLLFGISCVNFFIVTSAPAPRSSNVQSSGELDASKSLEANEGEYIFRRTFNLDKPQFFNTRFWLDDHEIFWLLSAPTRRWELPAVKRSSQNTLEDYGRGIVPHLVRIALRARDGRLEEYRRDFEKRWAPQRRVWLAKGRPPGDIAWPPPADAPPFDTAFGERILTLALARLAGNSPRRPIVVYGGQLSDEQQAENEKIRLEQVALKRIYQGRQSDAEKAGEWEKWYEEHRTEWEYDVGDKVEMFFLDTQFAKFWSNLIRLDLGTSFIHRQRAGGSRSPSPSCCSA
jgi:hypothetical protein